MKAPFVSLQGPALSEFEVLFWHELCAEINDPLTCGLAYLGPDFYAAPERYSWIEKVEIGTLIQDELCYIANVVEMIEDARERDNALDDAWIQRKADTPRIAYLHNHVTREVYENLSFVGRSFEARRLAMKLKKMVEV